MCRSQHGNGIRSEATETCAFMNRVFVYFCLFILRSPATGRVASVDENAMTND